MTRPEHTVLFIALATMMSIDMKDASVREAPLLCLPPPRCIVAKTVPKRQRERRSGKCERQPLFKSAAVEAVQRR